MDESRHAYDELYVYTMERGGASFILQHVVDAAPERDRAIDAWCQSVWAAYHDSRQTIIDLLREHRIIE